MGHFPGYIFFSIALTFYLNLRFSKVIKAKIMQEAGKLNTIQALGTLPKNGSGNYCTASLRRLCGKWIQGAWTV